MKEDTNPPETREWLEALDDVVKHEGPGARILSLNGAVPNMRQTLV